MNKYYIYAHETLLGKVFYIGKGSGRRAYDACGRTKAWKSFYRKYGRRVIFMNTNLGQKEALKLERYYISLYGRKDLKTGCLLNFTDGGESPTRITTTFKIPVFQYSKTGLFIKRHKSITAASKYLKISDETIRVAVNNPNKSANGFIFTSKKSEKFFYIKVPNSRCKKVFMYTIQGNYIKEFYSIIACSKYTNIPYQLISTCCRNKIRCTYGFRFSYKKYDCLGNMRPIKNGTNNGKAIKAIRKSDMKEFIFGSMIEADKALSVGFRQISKCCKGHKKQCRGYLFEFIK